MRNKTIQKSSIILIILLIIVSLCGINCSNNKTTIGFLTFEKNTDENEIKFAFSFLGKNKSYESKKISFSEIAEKNNILSNFDLLWFHYPDTIFITENNFNKKAIKALNKYINDGGKLLLTQNALQILTNLGLENIKPQTRIVEAKDYGYGRKKGFHAYRSHPVFSGLFGGSYIFSPKMDTTAMQVGYFNKNEKINAKVIAVDWAYIRLKEDIKLVLEYEKGKGKVIAIGAYMQFAIPNYHQTHFELFVNNVINYLTNGSKEKTYFWNYSENQVKKFSPGTKKTEYPKSRSWKRIKSEISFEREKATHNSWDMAANRIVIMGKENAGIEEIWTHPIMALRDYEIGYRKLSDKKINWLNDNKPEVIIEPHAFTRKYFIDNSVLTETITVDILNPTGVIHYHYKGDKAIKFYIRFKSNLRYMWPYSSRVFGDLNYARDENQNSFIIKDTSGDFVSIIGANKIPDKTLIGQYNTVYFEKGKLTGSPDTSFMVYAISEFDLNKTDKFDIVISASDQGIKTTRDLYSKAIQNPYSVYKNTYNYYNNLLENKLRINTPDKDLNEGYKWAVVGTDKFFVNTPGIGKSLVAGYATTAHGWDGGHKVNGRPGYAWYFGRDGQWSGFAVDDYGDFEKVKCILEQYLDFQDISGKIYHELTTSGVVHYDASDATPLFIVLAGHYFRNSGDIDFIKYNWNKIKKAIDFCYSTDTDNDKLIENTNVGHGWVEGGHLFGGKSTLYLSSCWAAALKEATYMAKNINKITESKKYKKDYETVVDIINDTFWNTEKQFFNHSINNGGGFITDITVMPAIPLYFNQIKNYDKTQLVLNEIASNNFTSNWGARIISEESEHFHPRGYHTGSVWPLYTGWVALAEYKNYKPTQGYSHIMNNILVYKDWAAGYIEEVLNGAVYQPSGVCSHQCWSETMALQPVIEGMLGLYPLAPENKLLFSPSLPFHWIDFSVENIRIGESYLQMEMKKENNKINYSFSLKGNKKINIDFRPVLPASVKINNIRLNGKKIKYKIESNSSLIIPEIDFIIDKKVIITIEYTGGISVIPLKNKPKPGDAAEGLRLISEQFEKNKFKILFEAQSGSEHLAKIFIEDHKIANIANANIITKNKNTYIININFEESSDKYSMKEIVIDLKK